ncbi:MAG: metalloprotease PmbA [Gammaproteobacteria bacterium]|nr:metalloprotease PmbA [Gammaproteobacteria bacterium]
MAAIALQQAESLGATQAEANLSQGAGFSVTARLEDVETLEHHRDQGLSVTVYLDQQKGSASTSDLRPDAIRETVEKACSLASYAAKDECAGLADPERLATEWPDLDLWHPWDIEVPEAIELALECEAAARAVDPRISNSEGATVSLGEGVRVYANSLGFSGAYPDSHHSISCSVIAKQGEEMQRDYEYTVSRKADQLMAAEQVGREAGLKTVQRLGSRKLKTCTTPVVFPARLARGLFGHLVGAVSGAALYRKSSFLLDSLGTQVLPEFVTIVEQPHIPCGLSSAPFDSEGVATYAHHLVEDGLLQSYVLGSYSARKLDMASTANAGGIHNLIVSHSDNDFDALLKQMNTGLLVTELMGQGVNSVTGDYSRGAAGFWVENGIIQYPVHEITIAGNLKDMLLQIVAVANDVDVRGGIQSGSVLLEHMTVAGS